MSNIQSILVLGAISLLAVISLRFNTSVLQNSTLEIENKVYLTAFSLADDLIEEIKQKAFDEKTIDFQAIATDQLTASDSLGKDSTEMWPNFDDIDDYDGYSKSISLPHAEGYAVISKVRYANPDGSEFTTQTYFKKVDVTVESSYLNYSITLSFIFSLHSKN